MAREPAYPIDPLFVDRWSPRSFTGEPVPDAVLQSAFEAARWAPSASNAQPWRFLITRHGDANWETFLGLLMPRNALWAGRASALVLILSARHIERRRALVDNVSHSFDAGAAWANFAHQALLLGWHSHGIGGFDRDAARSRLAIPEDYAIETIVALGRLGGLDTLHADFHQTESPNGRRSLDETVFAGRIGEPAFTDERNAA
ncbi:nitroreductase family protein [Sphingomonas quercus]|uniref:Nitroreductase family protein n=1 Tax=Sphingomonas quercus TaxID=2842451 RepID=A0ABS6BHA2_9SPHN|nr:nitroreductase family protein [Sphingomonas quercus]MBU3077685.1 nitroreductase family protein [Sphingomonas quercus]